MVTTDTVPPTPTAPAATAPVMVKVSVSSVAATSTLPPADTLAPVAIELASSPMKAVVLLSTTITDTGALTPTKPAPTAKAKDSTSWWLSAVTSTLSSALTLAPSSM